MPNGGNPSSATLGKSYVSGHMVHGLYFTNSYASTPPEDQRNIVDQRGRRIAAIVDGVIPAGRREAVWNAKRVPAGVYIWRIAIDGRGGWTGKIIVSK
jgi:hypothetical protein